MNDTSLRTLEPSPRPWSWRWVCILTVIYGVIGFFMVRAHTDGEVDPDDLVAPIAVLVYFLIHTILLTLGLMLEIRPESSVNHRYWLKQALVLQVVSMLWSGLLIWACTWSESFVFDQTLKNALQVAAAVEDFRFRKGAYPDSLKEVEEDLGYPLPRPVYRAAFFYFISNESPYLSFSRKWAGGRRIWEIDIKTGSVSVAC